MCFLKILKIKIYETVIFPVVLYDCTWPCTLIEGCWIRIFENRILKRIFGIKSNANGDWRRLHNEELHSLYGSPNIARVINSCRLTWAGHIARMEEGRSTFKILTGTLTRKITLGTPRSRWNIRLYLKEIGINTRNWVDLAQDRDYWKTLVNAALKLRVS